MTKVIGLISDVLSTVRRRHDYGVTEVFDCVLLGRRRGAHARSPRRTSRSACSPPSAEHLSGLMAEVGAFLTGRARPSRSPSSSGGQHAWGVPAVLVTHNVPDGLATSRLDRPLRHRRHRERRAQAKAAAGPNRVAVPRGRTISAAPRRQPARRARHRPGCRVARPGSALFRPSCDAPAVLRESDSHQRRRRHAPALSHYCSHRAEAA